MHRKTQAQPWRPQDNLCLQPHRSAVSTVPGNAPISEYRKLRKQGSLFFPCFVYCNVKTRLSHRYQLAFEKCSGVWSKLLLCECKGNRWAQQWRLARVTDCYTQHPQLTTQRSLTRQTGRCKYDRDWSLNTSYRTQQDTSLWWENSNLSISKIPPSRHYPNKFTHLQTISLWSFLKKSLHLVSSVLVVHFLAHTLSSAAGIKQLNFMLLEELKNFTVTQFRHRTLPIRFTSALHTL